MYETFSGKNRLWSRRKMKRGAEKTRNIAAARRKLSLTLWRLSEEKPARFNGVEAGGGDDAGKGEPKQEAFTQVGKVAGRAEHGCDQRRDEHGQADSQPPEEIPSPGASPDD